MADTEYHIPFPRPATETRQARARSGGWEVLEDHPIDWERFDRLLILMSLAIAERSLRKAKRTKMDPDVKIQVLDRLRELIEEYKNPEEDV